ncbi:transcription initiation factor TFIID subunit 5-like [Dioscorea cayenensis subsp. rotundata]|uniref:Transcription initiation factor TFIID subunit 5 n=1 Tax=Dioscorea cayennensis subsp. rotundata TaxID=55577 RepID=A0AB40BXH1_DIOCR|nr:transcription initiation factor TFIID subunit 5-like [Dioscorea cayenensis subsp. rotundata]XP_039132166.1 transcription initiation factor TFIID subunit 5-like [Dioscorea cayenensis subsp. rotundata]
MEDEEIEKKVLAYLKKKGFLQTELALQEELGRFSSSFHPDVPRPESGALRYHDGYSKLRSWAYSSLDLYKHELLRVLYPVFIHCFMDLVAAGYMQEARTFFHTFREDHDLMHLRDLQKLEGVLSPQHLEEMELARSLRQSKVNIKLCEYSYDLLLQYLQKTQALTMLGIVNEHINFQVSPGQPTSISEDADVVSLMGSSHEIAKQINQKEVHWGLLEDSLEERLEKAHSDSEKVEGENKEVDPDENKKRSTEGGKQGVPVKKLKKDKVVGTLGKNVRSETSTVSMAPRVKAELTLPVMPTEAEQSILEDLRNRVQLSSLALPSVSFYTFVNTHNGLNCSAISHDGSLVAGGFSDSSVKVWDVSKIGQAAKTFNTQGEDEASQNELLLGSDDGKRSYTLFQGHTGPVYSATFCPLGEFLLSSSSDSTIRLWSTKLNSNLVCYKGHNYPVWDVQFSPVGHYFASCSHDRTARVWSMDKIKPLRIMAGHLSDVDCIQWHPNCNYISTGSSDKTVRLWDVQSGECVRIFIGHRGMVLSLAMSPDGRYMASGDEDGTIMVWDLSTGRCVSPLMGHSSCVWTLAFSCEGTVLASGSADNTVKLWDVTASMKPLRIDDNKTGGTINRLRLLKVLPTKSTPVYTLQFSRRNLLFAAGALLKC